MITIQIKRLFATSSEMAPGELAGDLRSGSAGIGGA